MGKNLDLAADEVERVRNSFDQIWAISTQTADLFYGRLFASTDFVRPLFGSDSDEQTQKFISILATVVASLDDKADGPSLAERLGLQLTELGVPARHYAVVGEALLSSLQEGFGSGWTPGMEAAWRKAYALLSGQLAVCEHS